MTQLRSEIVVTADDRDAEQKLDRLIQKLERARDLAQQIPIGQPGGGSGGGGGGTGSFGPGGGQGGGQGDGTGSGQGGGQPGRGRVRNRAFFERGVEGTGRVIEGAVQNARSPTFAINTMGRAVTAAMTAASEGLKEIAQAAGDSLQSIPLVGAVAGVLGAGAVATRVGTGILNEAVTARYEQIMALATIERPMEQARISGGFGGGVFDRGLDAGARFGFRAQESAQLLSGVSRTIGTRGGGRAAFRAGFDPFEAMASGLSPEMIARVIGTGAPGGGAVQGVTGATTAVREMIGTLMGPEFGLRGSKVDEALARIASSTTQMAEQGLQLDLQSTTRVFAGLAATGAARSGSTRGRNVFAGMQGVRGALQLSQIGVGAARGFAGGFGGLADAAIQAEAFRRASSPLEAIEIMQQLAEDPGAIASVVNRQLGPEAAGLAFAGRGFSGEQARVLSGGILPGRVREGMGGADPGRLAVSRQLASNELDLMRATAADPGMNRTMISLLQEISLTLIGMSTSTAGYLKTVDDTLRFLAGR